jgi:cyclopropane-fatty-acyl-phospholipid synthase
MRSSNTLGTIVSATIIPPQQRAQGPRRHAIISRFIVGRLLARLHHGTIVLVDGSREHRYGVHEPTIRVDVLDQRAYSALVRKASLGLGASYIDGWWTCDDLTGLLQTLLQSIAPLSRRLDRVARWTSPFRSLGRRGTRVNEERDRDNIRAHYDVSNDFFELMLDETLGYSCAYFESPSVTLAEASAAKFDRLCRKLDIGPDDHVLEIGTGWGGFAMHAASVYGAHVTTTTISEAQFKYASALVSDAGMSERIAVLNKDYRELSGVYDKIVSIEMVEAIGWRQLDTYFSTCARLLKPDGLMGLQAIVIEDQSYERAKTSDDFIKRFVFPGGFIPSVNAMLDSMTSVTDLRVTDLEDIGLHYVETLRRWRSNLELNAEAVRDLELGPAFERLWKYYLCYCEAGFLERHVSDVQLVLARGSWRPSLEELSARPL